MRLFDTAFLVDLVNSDQGAVKVAEDVKEEGTASAISAITVHEYLFGVHLRYGGSSELNLKLASAARDLMPFEVIPLTKEVAELSAELHGALVKKGTPIGINDVYIAATALKFGLDLVSRNRRHFGRIPSLTLQTY